ncbi:MAG: ABC transporter permease [Planctomycetes bacterium]|nr:ABC transporter permease [Planctomycetota bacterium]
MNDLKYAFRRLSRTPGFTLVAAATLALGIGATATLFNIYNAAVLKPKPIPHPDQLMMVSLHTYPFFPVFSLPDVEDLSGEGSPFSDTAAVAAHSLLWQNAAGKQKIYCEFVTTDYMRLLGVHFVLGRGFTAEEGQGLASQPVMVLSHRFWKKQFNGSPDVLGKSLTLDQQAYTIVGVADESFAGTFPAMSLDAWLPVKMMRGRRWAYLSTERCGPAFFVIGRLKSGLTRSQGQAGTDILLPRLREARLQDKNWDNDGEQEKTWFAGHTLLTPCGRGCLPLAAMTVISKAFWPFVVVVGLVLLVACSNVANLLMVRALTRRQEMAVRRALGASAGHLARPLLAESILLALLGGTLALFIAHWGSHVLLALFPANLPFEIKAGFDHRIFAFTLVVALVIGSFFGLTPAWSAARIDVQSALKEDFGRTGSLARRWWNPRNGLVVTQVAICLALLVVAGLSQRSLWNMQKIDVGFDLDHTMLVTFSQDLAETESAGSSEFYQQLQAQVKALPEVSGAAVTRFAPFGGYGSTARIRAEHRRTSESTHDPVQTLSYSTISSDFFRTLKIPLVRGRDFTSDDQAGTTRVAIVNQALAEAFWPGENPIGKQLAKMSYGRDSEVLEIWEVCGVAADSRSTSPKSLTSEPGPHFYVSYLQEEAFAPTLLVRAAQDPLAQLSALKSIVTRLDPRVRINGARTFREQIEPMFVAQRVSAWLCGAAGLIGIVLASAGLYGMISFWVVQRTQEIGVRLALGADPVNVVRLVVRQGLGLTVVGLLIGLGLSLACAQGLGVFLYGVSPYDPMTLLVVVVILGVVAGLACFVPARKATRIDPMEALRYE